MWGWDRKLHPEDHLCQVMTNGDSDQVMTNGDSEGPILPSDDKWWFRGTDFAKWWLMVIPRDWFFYPTLTQIIDYFSGSLLQLYFKMNSQKYQYCTFCRSQFRREWRPRFESIQDCFPSLSWGQVRILAPTLNYTKPPLIHKFSYYSVRCIHVHCI